MLLCLIIWSPGGIWTTLKLAMSSYEQQNVEALPACAATCCPLLEQGRIAGFFVHLGLRFTASSLHRCHVYVPAAPFGAGGGHSKLKASA